MKRSVSSYNFYDDINHLLGSAETKIPTIKENVECFKRAIDGDDDAIDEFIVNNMKLVGGVVTKFIALYPRAQYLVDDMYCEGLMILTRSVRRWVARIRDNREEYRGKLDILGDGDVNILGYIYIAVYRNVQECYERESSETISEKMRALHTPPGSDSPTRKLDFPQEWFENQTYDAFEEIFYLEKIHGTCKTDVEKRIIDSRLLGLSQKEVAKKVGLSAPTIRKYERTLYSRFCKQQGLT
jgi:DNA-directed RNA polymerase sigma subunit (sigma70/sigma32)